MTHFDPDKTATPGTAPEPNTDEPTGIVAAPAFITLSAMLVAIGGLAFTASYGQVQSAARPVFGPLAWIAPILLDATIAVLIGIGIVLELNKQSGRVPRWAARALVALTIYANVAPAHGAYARILHAAPPTVWVIVVTIAEGAVRKFVNLTGQHARPEALARALWLLRPAATFRIWRAMRVNKITTYREALDREAARAAVQGRLRLRYGWAWRWRAPLAERIALRLDGRDPEGVAAILAVHGDTARILGTTREATTDDPAPVAPVKTAPATARHGTPAPPQPRVTALPAPTPPRDTVTDTASVAPADTPVATPRTATPVARPARVASLPVHDTGADLTVLTAADTAWQSLSKADAIREVDKLLPGRTASQVVRLLAGVSIKSDDVLVRKTRSRDRQTAAPSPTSGEPADEERTA